ncbi:MAG TPA: maleylpyruvate isomerase family mycothiol-dependent enzyme [Terrimesophilobacter sp.]|nr:maleylpyruvate isomerase family mycothiol-dependent enzyme [Terrimesophilobacter sp.]
MDHLAALHSLTEAFERDIPATNLDHPTAALRWSGLDLVAHLGGVHRWAAEIVRTGHRAPRDNVPPLEGDPTQWYSESRRELLDLLDTTDPSKPVWTHQRSHRTARYWHRRQAHETLIHLWDLRSVTDPNAPAPGEAEPALWVDTIDELFEVFATKRAEQERATLPNPLRMHATDHHRKWTIHPDYTCEPVAKGRRGATVTGTAGDLALFSWGRLAPTSDRLGIDGEQAVVDAFVRARIRP